MTAAETRPSLGPAPVKVARALALRNTRNNLRHGTKSGSSATLFYWQTVDDIARTTGMPRWRVKRWLKVLANDDLIDRLETADFVAYRMRQSFAETLWAA